MSSIFIKERLLSLIRNSILSPAEQSEFIVLLGQLSEKDIEILGSLFDKQPEWILRFYRNYKLKKQALENNDKNLFQKIVDREIKILENEDL